MIGLTHHTFWKPKRTLDFSISRGVELLELAVTRKFADMLLQAILIPQEHCIPPVSLTVSVLEWRCESRWCCCRALSFLKNTTTGAGTLHWEKGPQWWQVGGASSLMAWRVANVLH